MRDNRDNKAPKDDIKDKLVAINRVTKVVKGGRRLAYLKKSNHKNIVLD